jgi:hypothetical protein
MPSRPVLQSGHRLAQGLVFAMCGTSTDGLPFDHATRTKGQVNGSAPTFADGMHGRAVVTSLTATVQWPDGYPADLATVGTMFAICQQDVDGVFRCVFETSSSSSGDGIGLYMDDQSAVTNGYRLYHPFTGASANSNSDDLGASSQGKYHFLMASWSAGQARVWSNGILDATRTVTMGVATHAARNMHLGRSYSGSQFQGKIACALMWNRPLGTAEHMELCSDVWSLFGRRKRTVFVVPAAPGGFQAAWASGSNVVMGAGRVA